MEENKKGSKRSTGNKILLGIIAILILSALALGVYYCYDNGIIFDKKVDNNNSNSGNNNNNPKNNNINYDNYLGTYYNSDYLDLYFELKENNKATVVESSCGEGALPAKDATYKILNENNLDYLLIEINNDGSVAELKYLIIKNDDGEVMFVSQNDGCAEEVNKTVFHKKDSRKIVINESYYVNKGEGNGGNESIYLLSNNTYYDLILNEAPYGTFGTYEKTNDKLILNATHSFGSGCGFTPVDTKTELSIVNSKSISKKENNSTTTLNRNNDYDNNILVYDGKCTESEEEAKKAYDLGLVVKYTKCDNQGDNCTEKMYNGALKTIYNIK